MTISKKRKSVFHAFGLAIVTFWLVMMGLLVERLHFEDIQEEGSPVEPVDKLRSPTREWKEIYHKGNKVGYALDLIKPLQDGYFIQDEMYLRLNLMGLASAIHTVTQSKVDDNFLLKDFLFKMTSGAVSFHISGKVEGTEMIIKTGKGRKVRRIKLSSPPMVASSLGHFLKARKVEVGQTFRVPIFDPSTMAQKKVVIKVVAKETIKINRIKYNAYRLEMELWGKVLTLWLDETGATLKEEGLMGFTMIRSSAARAPRNIGNGGGADFYETAAVEVNRKLPDPSRLDYLRLQLDGMDHGGFHWQDMMGGRQSFKGGVMEIRRETSPLTSTYRLPYKDPDDKMKAYLEPEFNIESDDKAIKEKALEIAGKDKDPLSVARKLMRWVYAHLEKKPVVTVPSAIEVLRTRVGDCNEHATLLTAFMRALNIPARMSIGLVYVREKFYYHAWTEAYTGAWISVDATLNQMPADVSHLKLIEGNLDKQVEIAGLIGNLKIKVLDYGYDQNK